MKVMKPGFNRLTGALVAMLALQGLALITGCRNGQVPANNGLLPVRLQADWYPQPEQGGYYTALAKGYYQAEGLDVTILPLGQYTSGLQVVSSSGAEFG